MLDNNLDDLDLRLINLIQEDARKPVARMAEELGQPIPTIRDRVKRLEKRGVIKRYRAEIDLNAIGISMTAIIQIRVTKIVNQPQDFLVELGRIPEVESAYLVTGDFEAVVVVHIKDIEHLRRVIYEQISNISGVSGTNTMLVLCEDHWVTPRSL